MVEHDPARHMSGDDGHPASLEPWPKREIQRVIDQLQLKGVEIPDLNLKLHQLITGLSRSRSVGAFALGFRDQGYVTPFLDIYLMLLRPASDIRENDWAQVSRSADKLGESLNDSLVLVVGLIEPETPSAVDDFVGGNYQSYFSDQSQALGCFNLSSHAA